MTKFESGAGKETTHVPTAVHGAVFIVCFAIFIFGFYLMGEAYAQENGYMFIGGLLAASLAFFIPVHMRQD